MDKKVIFSGVQPSGDLTIGNYLGAIKNFAGLQEEYKCYYCIVDLHAITVPQVPADLRRKTLEVLSLYMACGIDPHKSSIFVQSHVPAHAELSWVLNSMTYMGQLSRMTQFKEKSKKSDENLNAGLFTYPVLMASDILLYNTKFVPVGDDQKQHLELARDLAVRFNNRYSETFEIPEPLISKTGARIMGLQTPDKKMSKSDIDENNVIRIRDSKDTIVRKIKRAVTDSEGIIAYNKQQLGIRNLIEIYAVFTGKNQKDIVTLYEGKGYGDFKNDLAEVIIEGLKPVQQKYNELLANKDYLEKTYKMGAEEAEAHARKTLRKVYKKVGFVQR